MVEAFGISRSPTVLLVGLRYNLQDIGYRTLRTGAVDTIVLGKNFRSSSFTEMISCSLQFVARKGMKYGKQSEWFRGPSSGLARSKRSLTIEFSRGLHTDRGEKA
eukprot:745902-Hanusia_phi.AAC.1